MGFLRPKVTTQAPPPPPVIEDTQAVQQDYADKLKRRRGRAASILSTPQASPVQTAAKTLLGG